MYYIHINTAFSYRCLLNTIFISGGNENINNQSNNKVLQNPPFCRWLPAEFIISLILSFFLPFTLLHYVWNYLIKNPPFFISRLLFKDITSDWYYSILVFAVLIYIFWISIPRVVDYFIKTIKTPSFLWFHIHGIFWGILIFISAWVLMYSVIWHRFQSIVICSGDFIIFAFITSIIILVIEKRIKTVKLLKESINYNDTVGNDLSILDEKPIECFENDDLHYENIVNELKNIIKGTYGSSGRVIALYGRNGSGKTSILNLLKKKIDEEKKNGSDISIEFFDVFGYRNEKELSKAFFRTLGNLTCNNAILPKISSVSDQYIAALYGLGWFKRIVLSCSFFSFNYQPIDGEESLGKEADTENLRKVFEWYLKNKSIVLVIDNIDRCSIKNRYLLFQFINAIGRIDNLYFIISASPDELLSQNGPSLVSLVD